MYFETADITVYPWLPPLVGFAISFFTSMGGVSGAFLLLPFQMSILGYTAPSVSATNQLYNVVAIPSGVYRYMKEGRMVWPLTAAVVVGTLPGVFLGALVRVTYLPNPTNFKLFAAAVLLYLGIRMARELAKNEAEKAEVGTSSDQGERTTRVVSFRITRIEYEFGGETYRVSTPGIVALSALVGIVGGIYGIGGGAIVAPFFVTFFRLPVHTIAGAALMGTLVTSVAGVGFYQGISEMWPGLSIAPDWKLGLLFGVGGAAGMYLGARCQKFVPSKAIKWMLAGILMLTAGRYVVAFIGPLLE